MVGATLDWTTDLERWLRPFLEGLGHKTRRQMCPVYVSGLIGPGDRKSIQPMAERLALGSYGAFTAWGDHIAGFNLALKPGERIVQAWRAKDWWPDHYSIATFDPSAADGGTELHFTQIGVPPHRFDGHSSGWVQAYWNPMQEIFEKGALSDASRAAHQAARRRINEDDL